MAWKIPTSPKLDPVFLTARDRGNAAVAGTLPGCRRGAAKETQPSMSPICESAGLRSPRKLAPSRTVGQGGMKWDCVTSVICPEYLRTSSWGKNGIAPFLRDEDRGTIESPDFRSVCVGDRAIGAHKKQMPSRPVAQTVRLWRRRDRRDWRLRWCELKFKPQAHLRQGTAGGTSFLEVYCRVRCFPSLF